MKGRGRVDLTKLAGEILESYRVWAAEYEKLDCSCSNGVLEVQHRGRVFRVTVDGDGDIVLLTRSGEQTDGMFFNLADLTTDPSQHPIKRKVEAYMRLYYGMTFL
jgi:hypothetical protein